MIRFLLAASLIGAAGYATEPPPRPNLLVVTVVGMNGVGAPARGLDAILPDPEIRGRVTPNLDRLAAMGCRFEQAYATGGADRPSLRSLRRPLESAGYRFAETPPWTGPIAPHRSEGIVWRTGAEPGDVRLWQRLTPTEGRGRRAKDDPSVAAWERLVESLEAQHQASAAADRIAEEDSPAPTLVVCTLEAGDTPRVAGVFFDRFPIDQIALPTEAYDRRTLAARMGVAGATLEADDQATNAANAAKWKRAVQAWLANATALDYAVGKLVDTVEPLNADDDPSNDWAVVLVASPSESRVGVTESASRGDLLLVVPGVIEPGASIATPIELGQVGATLVGLAAGDADANDLGRLLANNRPVRDPPEPIRGESVLPLTQPAGERYDVVAITAVGKASSVRSHRFRLVHTVGAPQRLYDTIGDPSGVIDLLDETNAASIGQFGLSPTQIEAVRAWLGWKLVERLGQPDPVGANSDRAATIASLREAGVFEPPVGYTAPMPGDFNRDGVVNAADKSLFRDTQGDEVPVGAGADADHDGRVNDEDGEIWRANYGRRAPAPPGG